LYLHVEEVQAAQRKSACVLAVFSLMEDSVMTQGNNQSPVQTQGQPSARTPSRDVHPMESLRQQVDRLFQDFDRGWRLPLFRRSDFDLEPLWPREQGLARMPAVDIEEKPDSFEITAELPRLDEKDIQIKLSNGNLTIQGQKNTEREEEKGEYFLSERHHGTFQRIFRIPESVVPERIEAQFSKGVLTLNLQKKSSQAQQEKTIEVKSGS
jgi:HSP20 family protein